MLDLYPQHVIFIALLVWGLMMILDRIFIRPVGRIIHEREHKIESENAQIAALSGEIDERTQRLETILKDARKESARIKEELIKSGEEVRERIVRESRENARLLLRDKMTELEREIVQAEQNLEKEIGTFSRTLRDIMTG